MRRFLALFSVAVAGLALGYTSAGAQAVPRNFDKGPVTLVIGYEVKPGQLNLFMQDFAAHARLSLDAAEKTGKVLNYSVAVPVGARAGEANFVEVIVFKDLASYDRSYADADKASIATYGSLDTAQQALLKRQDFATVISRALYQTLTFSK
jgi:hypothetical protein